jgi:hypothetical protein
LAPGFDTDLSNGLFEEALRFIARFHRGTYEEIQKLREGAGRQSLPRAQGQRPRRDRESRIVCAPGVAGSSTRRWQSTGETQRERRDPRQARTRIPLDRAGRHHLAGLARRHPPGRCRRRQRTGPAALVPRLSEVALARGGQALVAIPGSRPGPSAQHEAGHGAAVVACAGAAALRQPRHHRARLRRPRAVGRRSASAGAVPGRAGARLAAGGRLPLRPCRTPPLAGSRGRRSGGMGSDDAVAGAAGSRSAPVADRGRRRAGAGEVRGARAALSASGGRPPDAEPVPALGQPWPEHGAARRLLRARPDAPARCLAARCAFINRSSGTAGCTTAR